MRQLSALVVVLAFFASIGVAAAQTPARDPNAVRVGGNIKAPQKIKNVDSIYPPIAQSAHKEGVVILELLVDPAGKVQDATVLKSEPLLNQAALNAVKQWEYAPTFLNGAAVPVYYTVVVSFSLAKTDAGGGATSDAVSPAAPAAQPVASPQSTTPAPDAADQAPVRVGGGIKAPMKVVNVDPVYPPAALASRVEGVVILELLIAPQGYVQNARILKSIPELDQAALDAVYQWVYTPTLLNGVPVPILYNITVAFSARR